MKNILHITGLKTSKKIGGLEKWYIEYAKEINKSSNHKIFLLYSKEKPDEYIQKEFSKYNIETLVFSYAFSFSNIIKYNTLLKDKKISIVHSHFENTRWFIPIAKLRGLITYWHLLMGNYYVVNTDWRKNTKTKMGVYYYKLKTYFLQFFIDKIYCASHGVLNEYKSFYHFYTNKIEVNYLGMSLEQLSENKKRIKNNHKNGEIIRIGCIAFHGPIKGVDILIKAIGLLNNRGFNIELIQIGGSLSLDGDRDTKLLKDLAQKENINNISWMGIQSDPIKFLIDLDIYCQPSRHEALSFTIMEAMSVGLPIVASNTCGIPEIVKNNKNGFLFEVEDFVNCANSIERLIKDVKLRKEMGKKSIEIINLSRFTTEENLKKLVANYKL